LLIAGKIARAEAEGIMIVPFCLPSHVQLVHLRVDVPRTFPQRLIMTMLKMPGKEDEFRPMFLMVCRLSGNPLKCREFLRELRTSSYNFGDMELLNSTHLTLGSGYILW